MFVTENDYNTMVSVGERTRVRRMVYTRNIHGKGGMGGRILGRENVCWGRKVII
jgi:hypothetical protein